MVNGGITRDAFTPEVAATREAHNTIHSATNVHNQQTDTSVFNNIQKLPSYPLVNSLLKPLFFALLTLFETSSTVCVSTCIFAHFHARALERDPPDALCFVAGCGAPCFNTVGLTVNGLGYGGASVDKARGDRMLMEIQQREDRGRFLLRRYQRSGRLSLQLARLTPMQRTSLLMNETPPSTSSSLALHRIDQVRPRGFRLRPHGQRGV